MPRGQYEGQGPLAVFGCAWHYRQLVVRLTVREIEARFRGSLLGKVWAGIVPLFMLSLYTFVFGVLLKLRWPGLEGSTLQVALLYFSGLILFDFVLECLMRAPALLAEQISYIKKVLFPLEILAWVVIGGALFRVLVGGAILLAFYLAIDGLPPLSALAAPLLVLPLTLVALCFTWFLSAIGVFVRDFRHAVLMLAPVTMFLTPIFFPLSAVSEPARTLLYLNPLTFIVESMRATLFLGEWPNWPALALYTGLAWAFAWAGRSWFLFVRGEFADVI
ncbi:MAG TPA: ABC transporter permease [Stellaceae bacterium]|nr:ABC transporter permease [Stellaceae bacterium]